MSRGALSREEIRQRVDALGPWFHNLDLNGVPTAPSHFLGDYPNVKWRRFSGIIPDRLEGKTVLDIGCNAGFYAMEMKRRGAKRVLGLDSMDEYLRQARFAAEVNELEIEFRKLSVYDVGSLGERFDIVIFMGVLYHLRHPLLALDLIHEHVADDVLLFQSMQRGSKHVVPLDDDYEFDESDIFFETGFPKLHFIERRYSDDWTNWWVPNRAGTEAMLRSAGFAIDKRIEEEVYVCRKASRPYAQFGPAVVYPAKGAA
jgi:tRNA (mo5U34)-methyltransferase